MSKPQQHCRPDTHLYMNAQYGNFWQVPEVKNCGRSATRLPVLILTSICPVAAADDLPLHCPC